MSKIMAGEYCSVELDLDLEDDDVAEASKTADFHDYEVSKIPSSTELPLLSPKIKNKRTDIQIWRSIAIVSVLLFHVWPQWFPNGYLGVDIFFVLSGFLMAVIFAKFDTVKKEDILTFYTKRVKRIVPVYLIIILILSLILYFLTWDDYYTSLKTDALFVITFLSNVQNVLYGRGYFDIDFEYRFFKHCWSLAVEMQFYLLVPFIFIFTTNLFPRQKISFLASIAVVSWIYQFYFASEKEKYLSTFCRIWQFAVGILACQLKNEDVNSRARISVIWIFFGCLFLLMVPVEMPIGAVSTVVVVSTGIIVSMSSSKWSPFESLETCKTTNSIKKRLVYLGDMSYTLYLIHWPLITIYHFIQIDAEFPGFIQGMCLILASLAVSAVFYQLIEKNIINWCSESDKTTIVLLISLYFCFFSASFLHPHSEYNTPSQLTLDLYKNVSKLDLPMPELPPNWTSTNDIEFAVFLKNNYCRLYNYSCVDTFASYTSKEIPEGDFCEEIRDQKRGYGNLTAMVMGNSHAGCYSRLVFNSRRFRRVIVHNAWGCEFPITNAVSSACIENWSHMIEILRKVKPDIVYFVFAYGTSYDKPIRGQIQNDFIVKKMNADLKIVENYTQKIVLMGPNIQAMRDARQVFIAHKMRDKPITFSQIGGKVNKPQLLERIQEIHCEKCLFSDPWTELFENNSCQAFDPVNKLPLMRDVGHIDVVGLRKFKNSFEHVTALALNP